MAPKALADMTGLVAVKGHAAPAAPSIPAARSTAQETTAAAANEPTKPAATSFSVYKSMTLKLDKARYTKIKQLGLDEETTSQDLLIEALDLLFAKRAAAQ